MRIPFSLIAALLVGLSLVFFAEPASAATLQPGFDDQVVTSVGSPTSLAFAPDDRMLLTSQSGQLRVLDKARSLLESPALDLAAEICANPSSTKGLLGVAVDPSFATNNYIYVYYTFNKTGDCASSSVNRVARYALSSDNVATFNRILIDNYQLVGTTVGIYTSARTATFTSVLATASVTTQVTPAAAERTTLRAISMPW